MYLKINRIRIFEQRTLLFQKTNKSNKKQEIRNIKVPASYFVFDISYLSFVSSICYISKDE